MPPLITWTIIIYLAVRLLIFPLSKKLPRYFEPAKELMRFLVSVMGTFSHLCSH